jgi:hypothetical protein
MKRTTVILDERDQEDLKFIAGSLRTTETDAMRKSIRITKILLAWESNGGEIIMDHDGDQHRIKFV